MILGKAIIRNQKVDKSVAYSRIWKKVRGIDAEQESYTYTFSEEGKGRF